MYIFRLFVIIAPSSDNTFSVFGKQYKDVLNGICSFHLFPLGELFTSIVPC